MANLFFALLIGVAIIIVLIVIRVILKASVKDEVEHPLANCDTSMLEEVMPEKKEEENKQ